MRGVLCGSVWQCVAMHHTVVCGIVFYFCIHKQSRSQYTDWYALIQGGGGIEPHIPCILIQTDQQYE
jgi:lipoprotein signal peptidase